MSAWSEQTLGFACEGERLLGILARPAGRHAAVGVLVVVGGPQVRVGSHRQFVLLARHLAVAGFPVLRFDVRGMGDSSGAQHSFEQIGPDIGAAIDAFTAACPGLERVALWGLCDGASAALLYLHQRRDPRVAGLMLLNPWVRSEASLARTHVKYYYRQRLMERAFWRKLASGQVALSALSGLWRNIGATLGSRSAGAQAGPASYQDRMAQAWVAFAGPRLLLLSERDHTANEFLEYTAADAAWRAALVARPAERVKLAGADHTCSTPGAQAQAQAASLAWLQSMAPGGPARA
jgi:exosortase A-associated hydrolase 1